MKNLGNTQDTLMVEDLSVHPRSSGAQEVDMISYMVVYKTLFKTCVIEIILARIAYCYPGSKIFKTQCLGLFLGVHRACHQTYRKGAPKP